MTKATIYAHPEGGRRIAVTRKLLARHNEPVLPGNGIFTRYRVSNLTAEASRPSLGAMTSPRY